MSKRNRLGFHTSKHTHTHRWCKRTKQKCFTYIACLNRYGSMCKLIDERPSMKEWAFHFANWFMIISIVQIPNIGTARDAVFASNWKILGLSFNWKGSYILTAMKTLPTEDDSENCLQPWTFMSVAYVPFGWCSTTKKKKTNSNHTDVREKAHHNAEPTECKPNPKHKLQCLVGTRVHVWWPSMGPNKQVFPPLWKRGEKRRTADTL